MEMTRVGRLVFMSQCMTVDSIDLFITHTLSFAVLQSD